MAEASAAEVTCSSEEGQVGTTDGLDSPDSPVWGLNGTKLLGGSQDKNSKRGKTNESGAEVETNEGIAEFWGSNERESHRLRSFASQRSFSAQKVRGGDCRKASVVSC